MSENTKTETFEESYKKLESIVRRLETESPDLDAALKLFKEGRAAADVCRKTLENAELQLKTLREGDTEEEEEIDF